ncbi:MAG: hypothetical protein V4529_16525 [Gemmatimonadota bacterium]
MSGAPITEAELDCPHGHINCTQCYEARRLSNALARAEAAEKRAAELTEDAIEQIGQLERELSILRATPAAAVREARSGLAKIIRGDDDYSHPELLEAVDTAERALAAAEAGERTCKQRPYLDGDDHEPTGEPCGLPAQWWNCSYCGPACEDHKCRCAQAPKETA